MHIYWNKTVFNLTNSKNKPLIPANLNSHLGANITIPLWDYQGQETEIHFLLKSSWAESDLCHSLCEEKAVPCTTKILAFNTRADLMLEFELLPQQEKFLPSSRPAVGQGEKRPFTVWLLGLYGYLPASEWFLGVLSFCFYQEMEYWLGLSIILPNGKHLSFSNFFSIKALAVFVYERLLFLRFSLLFYTRHYLLLWTNNVHLYPGIFRIEGI